ncbi:Uncharacterised protein [Mycolicibacterium phlei]|jgi:hypothetical protein|uniref:Uncharacterized protein n=1 Tax=Mycolicibacterium phlei DSM 43239 = CCUG 21000 TaxID=1226750 RepID=A0A5N5VDR2_MYCPH|nr:hypothetical protein [Mycolicibacterium phlei]VEG11335.1 Uncharacterised protein [Mycobacteroides chelonae]AMO63238.1 hypothetical protein MPHLCCUG_04452 [Mycolicibacterium phlei]EID16139.1 hypothetical protein MPHLEI_06667 [Mycolicibacterium phlei RIVM601174]KAB7759896.1 hypothetical protein MPHL21000_02395 [Mycolicibacterium phlei DSM 43239 = CCUG 21000]KXW64263.1 hypothetical protein MPHL43072_06755 [Mycolicibacterium phlei DSM 43072]
MEERLSKAEIRKDAVQEIFDSGVATVTEVATIITTAVRDVANAIGGFATDAFEIRDGVRRASQRLDDDGGDEPPAR